MTEKLSDTFLVRWTAWSSGLFLAGSLWALWQGSVLFLLLSAVTAFSWLMARGFPSRPDRWTLLAQGITLGRLLACLYLLARGTSMNSNHIFAWATAQVLADILDGWAARRGAGSGRFGEYFDKECDALFVLVICLVSVRRGDAPAWFCLVGWLRPISFYIKQFSPLKGRPDQRFPLARILAGLVMALLLAHLLFPVPLIRATILLLLGWSFGREWLHSFGLVPLSGNEDRDTERS